MKSKVLEKVFISKFGFYFIFLMAFAVNLSSHTYAFWPGDNWWLRSAYWFVYLSLELSCIFAIYYLLEKIKSAWPKKILFILTILVSWLPFGLAISMVDIATARPSMSFAISELQNTGFLPTLLSAMVVNVLPRHLVFGGLIYLIYFNVRFVSDYAHVEVKKVKDDDSQDDSVMQAGFVDKLSAEVKAEPKMLQAKEHYLHVTTQQGQELILYKFGQAIREMPADYGLQVHRSFWLAKKNIRGWFVANNGLKVRLYYGDCAPVSRRFEHYIKQNFEEVKE